MLKKIIRSPYFPILMLAILCLIVLLHFGFRQPDYYINETSARFIRAQLEFDPLNELLKGQYLGLINKNFYLVGVVYSIFIVDLLFFSLFLSKGVKKYNEVFSIFKVAPRVFVFTFVNLFYIFMVLCLYSYSASGVNLLNHNGNGYSDLLLNLFDRVLIIFGVFYYLSVNIFLGLNYSSKRRSYALLVINIVGVLFFCFLCCVQVLYTYGVVNAFLTICSFFWLYILIGFIVKNLVGQNEKNY